MDRQTWSLPFCLQTAVFCPDMLLTFSSIQKKHKATRKLWVARMSKVCVWRRRFSGGLGPRGLVWQDGDHVTEHKADSWSVPQFRGWHSRSAVGRQVACHHMVILLLDEALSLTCS